ncbi:MAG: hypothetical protein D3924_16525, partial [Candidatus Electrothrix sp. AR4]|nr:hypothetical protein [Candidatus Electrothrix sp. AR4]
LNEEGFERHPWETASCWIERIKEAAPGLFVHADMQLCLQLHYKDQFGVGGLTSADKTRLEKKAEGVLDNFDKALKSIEYIPGDAAERES